MSYDGKGKVLRITSFDFFPWYVFYNDDQGKIRFRGILGNMIGNVTASLNMTYAVIPPADGEYGMALGNGSFNGMLRMVQMGAADIAAGPFAVSDVIFEHLHTPPSVSISALVMLSGMRTAFVNKAQSFTNSFASEVWLGLFISFAVMLALMAAQEFLVHDRKMKVNRFFLFGFELFQTLLQEASKTKFKGPFARLLGAIWLLVSLILGHSFASQCRANLIVKFPTERIDTVEDVLDRPHLTIYYAKNTPLEIRMMNLAGERGARLRQHVIANSEGHTVSGVMSDDLRERIVSKKGVIFMVKLSLTPIVHRWCEETENFYHIGSESLAELSGSWITSRNLGRDLNAAINMKILRILSMDVSFVRNQATNPALCITSNTPSTSEAFQPSQLLDFDSVFKTFFVTTGISVVVFLFEIIASKLPIDLRLF